MQILSSIFKIVFCYWVLGVLYTCSYKSPEMSLANIFFQSMAYVFILLRRVPRNSCLTASNWNTSSNWNNGFGLKLKEWLLLNLKAVVLQNRTTHQLSQGSSFPTAYLGTCHPSQLCESIPHNSFSPSLPLSLLLSLTLSPPIPTLLPPLLRPSDPLHILCIFTYIYTYVSHTYVLFL